MLIIRPAESADGEALAGIYSPYVLNTVVTFDYVPPAGKDFSEKIIKSRYPFLIAEQDGEILGYAYASRFKDRAAYDWACETSIYLRMDSRGKGIGTRLYESLEEKLKAQNIFTLEACITYPNPESISFHEKRGFKLCAHFHEIGYKFGRWLDVVWMEKSLLPNKPKKPFYFSHPQVKL